MLIKFIELTRGQFAIVDADDFERLSQWKWHLTNGYAARSVYGPPRQEILMHRFLAPRSKYVDHINRDKLDCRKENLRECTNSQNLHNRPKQKNNKSGYKGVYWFKPHQLWRAKIQVNGAQIHLGYFKNKKEAAEVYDSAAKKHHGDFARTNFPCP